jgi:hypothetical protein
LTVEVVVVGCGHGPSFSERGRLSPLPYFAQDLDPARLKKKEEFYSTARYIVRKEMNKK